jgi:hypothetical protein
MIRFTGRRGKAAAVVAATAAAVGALVLSHTGTVHGTAIRVADAATTYNSTVSSTGSPATVYAFPGGGATPSTALPSIGSIDGGIQARILCYFTGTTPVTGTDGQGGDPYWDEISTTGIGILAPLSPGDVAVIPDAAMQTTIPVNVMVPACPLDGVIAPPAPPTSTPTATPSTQTSQQPGPVPPVPPGTGNKQQEADCLENEPGNSPTSIVEPNGDGWSQYTTVGGPGTRPGTATACLDQSHVAGTAASAVGVIGMQDAYTEVNNWNLNPDANNRPATQMGATGTVQRCHLIAGSNALGSGSLGMTVSGKGSGGSLGGNGAQASNLVPCWQNVNMGKGSSATNMTTMQAVENAVRQLADTVPPGSAIYYQVTPNYRSDNSTIPESITMVAYLQNPGEPPPGIEVVATTVIPNARTVPAAVGGNVTTTLNLGN